MKKRKCTGLIVLILSVAAAVLNATPNAVLMRFADDGGPFYKYVSGFSMLPVGYGVWGAMVAGVCSIILAILGIVNLVKDSEGLRKWMFGIAVAALLMRLTLFLFSSVTMIGVIILVILASETVLLYFYLN